VLMGKEFWLPLLDFLRSRLVENKTIDPADYDLITVTDSPEEAVGSIRDIALHRFGLTYAGQIRRRWLLGE
jgi:predicted Rossmann-fold nucleotide-binding protein